MIQIKQKRILSFLMAIVIFVGIALLAIPTKVNAASTSQKVMFVASDHVLMTRADGRFLGWGDNSKGQLGLGPDAATSYDAPVEIKFFDTLSPIKQLVAAKEVSFVLLNNGELYSAGSGTYGKHGQGNVNNQNAWGRAGGELKFKTLYANSTADYILAEDNSGNLYGWGDNSKGQLGLTDGTLLKSSPYLIKDAANIKELWLGATYVEYIDLNGDMFWWGENASGQNGLQCSYTETIHKYSAVYDRTVQTTGGFVECYKWGPESRTNKTVNINPTISCNSAVLFPSLPQDEKKKLSSTPDDEFSTYSYKTYSNLILGLFAKSIATITNVKAGTNHALLIQGGTLYGWGAVDKKQLGDITTDTFAPVELANVNSFITTQNASDVHLSDVYVAGNSNYMTFGDGSVWVWGDNSYGKTGCSGAPLLIASPTKIEALQNVKIEKIVAGLDTNYYITDAGEIYVSGSNINGIAGLGETYKDTAIIDAPTKLTIGFSEKVTPPVAPAEVKVPAEANPNQKITVKWNEVPGAASYLLTRTVEKETTAAAVAPQSIPETNSKAPSNNIQKAPSNETKTVETYSVKIAPATSDIAVLASTIEMAKIYEGVNTQYDDTIAADWSKVTYSVKAANSIGDYSSPVETVPISIKPATSNPGGTDKPGDPTNPNDPSNPNVSGGNTPNITLGDTNITMPEIKFPDFNMAMPKDNSSKALAEYLAAFTAANSKKNQAISATDYKAIIEKYMAEQNNNGTANGQPIIIYPNDGDKDSAIAQLITALIEKEKEQTKEKNVTGNVPQNNDGQLMAMSSIIFSTISIVLSTLAMVFAVICLIVKKPKPVVPERTPEYEDVTNLIG